LTAAVLRIEFILLFIKLYNIKTESLAFVFFSHLERMKGQTQQRPPASIPRHILTSNWEFLIYYTSGTAALSTEGAFGGSDTRPTFMSGWSLNSFLVNPTVLNNRRTLSPSDFQWSTPILYFALPGMTRNTQFYISIDVYCTARMGKCTSLNRRRS